MLEQLGLKDYIPYLIKHIKEDRLVRDLAFIIEDKKIKPVKTIVSHIEEPDCVSYDELLQVERNLEKQGLCVQFAYDTMKIEI